MTVISQVSLSKTGIFKEGPQNRSVIESMNSPTSGLAALMASLGYLPDPHWLFKIADAYSFTIM